MTEIYDIQKIEDLITNITAKIRRIAKEVAPDFPYSRDMQSGEWITTEYCDWSGGHWVGLLLKAYDWSGDKYFLEEATKKLPALEKRIEDEDEFLGFIFRYSYAHLADTLKSDEYKQIALRAANRLLEMHNKKIGLIPLGSQCQIIGTRIKGSDLAGVDDAIIPNTLLFWANERTSDRRYRDVAIENLDRTIALFMRPDGSTIHMVKFDLESGAVIDKWNNLGYDSTTTWTRGQAFFLLALAYGFNVTGDRRYNDIYSRALSFFLSMNKGKDLTPYYDMADPNIPNVPLDTSSLAILAESYLLMLKNGYGDYSILQRIVDSLVTHIDDGRNDSSVILGNGCFDYPRKVATNSELIFSDYYCYDFFLELIDFIRGEKN